MFNLTSVRPNPCGTRLPAILALTTVRRSCLTVSWIDRPTTLELLVYIWETICSIPLLIVGIGWPQVTEVTVFVAQSLTFPR